MSASSPWLAAPSSSTSPSLSTSTSALDASIDIDPWSRSTTTTTIIDSDLLHPSTPSQQQHQLRSRRSSPAFPSASTNAQVVDRHPLRSPSPGTAGPSNLDRPHAAPRRPSAVASEWKAIGAGLAGLFGGSSSSNASSSSYRWPADPATSTSSKRAARQSASHAGNLIQTEDDGDDHADYYDDDEARKGRPINAVETTLDRLEDWFGLKQHQHQQQQHNSASAPSQRTAAAPTTRSSDEQQVRVLIHPVAPTDTLPSLALHYGADIQVLRKSNKLWPGDPVQIRKVIYIPVDSCKHRPPNAEIKVVPTRAGAVSSSSETANANTLVFVPKTEEEDLLIGTPTAEISQPNLAADHLAAMRLSDPASDFLPDTNKAYMNSAAPAFGTSLTRAGSLNAKQPSYPASLTPALRNLNAQQQAHSSATKKPSSSIGGSNTPSVAASASGASSGFVPPRQPLHVAKVSADQLRFFASESKTKGKPDPADTGESGIDDLLAIGAQQQQHDGARPQLSHQTSISNVSGYRGDDDDEGEDEWKPNTWHFGSSSNKPSTGSTSSSFHANGSPEASSSNYYTGWNDAPPPNAIVAKAFDGGKAYQKRQSQKSHRLLYDLAAGLPANPGAASKWARPIQFGDSLPNGDAGGGMRSGGGSIGGASKGKGGLGKLLDDTIRGRISVEAALEGALDGVRGKSSLALPQSNGMPPPPRRSPAASRQTSHATSTPTLLPPPSPPPAQAATTLLIDPLRSPSNKMRPSLTSNPSSSGLEQRRKVDWTKGKDD